MHHSDVQPSEVDNQILGFLPVNGMTFNGVVLRLREEMDWAFSKGVGETLAHESLKRLEKAGNVHVVNPGPDHPLCYCRTPANGEKP